MVGRADQTEDPGPTRVRRSTAAEALLRPEHGLGSAARVVALLLTALVLAAVAAGLWLATLAWRRRNPAAQGVLRARPLFGDGWSRPLPIGRFSSSRATSEVSGLAGSVSIRAKGLRRTAGGLWETAYLIRYTPKPDAGEELHPDWSYCRPGGSILVNGVLFVHEDIPKTADPSTTQR